tara:strand:+ start:2189 stop:3727 length:1539 start_codon:yes stop_codon:yes gene_type:complete
MTVSKARDIATFLGRTDSANPSGIRLMNSSEIPNVDSANILSINGVNVFNTLDSLPITNLRAGQQAFVRSNNRFYISQGTGWYNALAATNNAPFWDSVPLDEYSIVDSATPLIVIADPGDSDGTETFVNQSFGTDSAQYMVTVSNDSSVFTFTPKTKAEIATAIEAGNLTDSNGDFEFTFKWSDGINFISKAATITYNTVERGLSPTSMPDYPAAHIDTSYSMIHMKFNGDGTALTWWYQYQNMEWWDLSTPYDLSTATINNSKSSSPNNLLPSPYDNFLSFDYNGDGTKMITLSYRYPSEPKFGLAEWNLSTPYDPNSRGSSPSTNKSITSTNWQNLGYGTYNHYYYIDWQANGKYVTIGHGGTNSAKTLLFENTNFSNSPYDFSSVDFTNVVSHLDPSNFATGTKRNTWFSDDGTEVWFPKSSGKVLKATFSTPWDFSTVSDVATTALTEKNLGSTGVNSVGGIQELIVVPSVRKVFIGTSGGRDQNGDYWNDGATNGTGSYNVVLEFRL